MNKIGQWLRPPVFIGNCDVYCEISQTFSEERRVIHIEKQNIDRLIEALKKWQKENP